MPALGTLLYRLQTISDERRHVLLSWRAAQGIAHKTPTRRCRRLWCGWMAQRWGSRRRWVERMWTRGGCWRGGWRRMAVGCWIRGRCVWETSCRGIGVGCGRVFGGGVVGCGAGGGGCASRGWGCGACACVGACGGVWLGVGGVVSDRADVWAFEGWVWRGRKVLRPYLWGVGVRVWLVGWCGGCWCYGTGCSGCGQAVGVMVCMWYGFCGWCDAKRGNFRTPSIALDFFDRCWVY